MSQQTTTADAHAGNPTPATYFKVAMILSAITAAELAIFEVTWLSYGIIPVSYTTLTIPPRLR